MASAREKRLNTRYSLLRSWYGKERAKLEIVAHSPGPVNAAEIMTELCGKLIDRDVATFITLETRWKQIISGPFSAYAKPARFQQGVLFLEVRHSALMRELAPSLDLFLARIAKVLGPGVCTEIRLVPAGSVSRGRK